MKDATRKTIGPIAVAVLGMLVLAAPAHASRLSTATTIPVTTLGSGETVEASIYMENIAAGDKELPISHILWAPSCRSIEHPATCEKGDRFVYNLESAIGAPGTKCGGISFAIAPFAEGVGDHQGYFRLTPSSPLTLDPANSPGNADACGIKIKTGAGHGPALDVDTSQAEQQTHNALIVAGKDGNVPWDHRSYSTSTMNRATLDLRVSPVENTIGLGGQTFANLVTQSFGFIDHVVFKLYGPQDAACSGVPLAMTTAFEDGQGSPAFSSGYTPEEIGTYRWTVSFTGNRDWKPAASECGAPGTTVEVADETAPFASFLRGPKPKVFLRKGRTTRNVGFALASTEPGSAFQCRIDAAALAPCQQKMRVNVGKGKHMIEAVAIDAAGNTSAPVQHKFRVVPRRKAAA